MTTVALVTGANRGLGLATVRQLSRRGVTAIVGARSAANGERAVAELRGEGLDAEWVALDVTSAASVQAAAEQVEQRHGRLDILVNNAGILPEFALGENPARLDVEQFETTFATNVFGAVSVTQRFLPLLARSERGRIVNVSSTMGSLSDQLDPTSGFYGVVMPGYQASKAALNAVTIALSKSLENTKINVNSICPGWLQTDLGGAEGRAQAPMTAGEGAGIVVQVALSEDDASGTFVDRNGVVPW